MSSSESATATIDLGLVECPVCSHIPTGQMLQCKMGHSCCSDCLQGLHKCPECRTRLDVKVRNLTMESVLENMSVGCRFQKYGCTAQVNVRQLESHETTCDHRPFSLCEMLEIPPMCNWVWDDDETDDLYVHLLTYHSGSVNFLPVLNEDGTDVVGLHLEEHLENFRKYGKEEQRKMLVCFTYEMPEKEPSTVQEPKTISSYLRSTIEPAMSIMQKLLGVESEVSIAPPEKLPILAYFYNDGDAEMCATFLHLGKEENVDVCLTVEICPLNNNGIWKWIGKPAYYRNAEHALINPSMKIPLQNLLGSSDDDLNEVLCKISMELDSEIITGSSGLASSDL